VSHPQGVSGPSSRTALFALRTHSSGVLERVSDVADAARIFWRIDDVAATSVFDARGNLLRSNLGNGLGTAHTFDALSGKAFELRAGVAAGGYTNALSHKYEYDLADNLARRTDAIKGITDSYKYDRLNRMSEYAVNSGEAAANRVVTIENCEGQNCETASDCERVTASE
jgi:YD repeat-containing protein